MSNQNTASDSKVKRPLEGFRVLTVDNYFAGNYGPLLFAFHGAEVVKIETLKSGGDPLRTDPPFLDAENKRLSHGELRLMRGKKSAAIDIASEAGNALLGRLIEKADVFWTNLRPASAKRLRIDNATVQAINPRIIYASVSGFGLPGEVPSPFEDEPAFDIIVQALSGLMARNAGPDAVPQYNGIAVGDQVTSLFTAFGVIMALLDRERGSGGACVDVAMFDAMLSLNEKTFSLYGMGGKVPPPRISATNAPFGAYRAKDGYVVIGVGGNILWARFCKAIGQEELTNRPDLDAGMKRVKAEKEVIRPLIEQWLSDKTVEEASAILLKFDVPASPILEVDNPTLRQQAELRKLSRPFKPDQLDKSVNLIQSPVRYAGYDSLDIGGPHALGEDTEAVLRSWLNMGDAEITAAKKAGTVA
jgi:formyl-CoA transferase